MAQTVISGAQIKNATIQRVDLDVGTVGQAVVAKIVQGTNVTLTSTGADSGTGDVTISVPSGGTGPAGLDGSPLGTVMAYTVVTPPNGWLLCDGASYLRATYQNLFNLIGTTYGSVDGTHFNVPDLRGKFILGSGQGTGLTNRVLAAIGGEEKHILLVAELASHTHGLGGHYHGMDHLHDLQNHSHLGVDHLHGVPGVDHLHSMQNHVHSYVHPATSGATWSGSGWTNAADNTGGPNVPTTAAADRSLATTTGAMDRGAQTGGPNINNTGYASTWSASWANTGGPSGGSDGAGSDTAHNTMPPFCVLVYIIKYGVGDFVNGVPGPPGPTGPQGIQGNTGATGNPAWTLVTTSSFTVPAYGSNVTVNVADSSWIAVGEWVYVEDGNAAGTAGQLVVTGKTPTSVTFLNPQPNTTGLPIADATQSGLLRILSGLTTDYVGGDNTCHDLAAAISGSGVAVQKTGDTMTGALGGIFAITTLQITGAWPKTGTINVPFKADLLVNIGVSFYTSTAASASCLAQLDGVTGVTITQFVNEASSHKSMAGSAVWRGVTAGNHSLGIANGAGTITSDSGDWATFGVIMIRVP